MRQSGPQIYSGAVYLQSFAPPTPDACPARGTLHDVRQNCGRLNSLNQKKQERAWPWRRFLEIQLEICTSWEIQPSGNFQGYLLIGDARSWPLHSRFPVPVWWGPRLPSPSPRSQDHQIIALLTRNPLLRPVSTLARLVCDAYSTLDWRSDFL